jgi:hypothetical protein
MKMKNKIMKMEWGVAEFSLKLRYAQDPKLFSRSLLKDRHAGGKTYFNSINSLTKQKHLQKINRDFMVSRDCHFEDFLLIHQHPKYFSNPLEVV